MVIGPLGIKFSDFVYYIKIQNYSSTKMYLTISSEKWRPFLPVGDELSNTVTTSLNLQCKCIAIHVRSRCLRCQYKWVPELITISPPRQYYLPSKCHQIDHIAITSWLKYFMLRLAIWNTLTKKRLQHFGRLNNEEQILILNGHSIGNTTCIYCKFGTINSRYMS